VSFFEFDGIKDFSASVGRGNVEIEKKVEIHPFFLPCPPVSWRSNRLPARPGTWPLEEEDEPAMVRECREVFSL